MKQLQSRHGLILPLTLLIVALLAILSASFAFQMRAHSSATQVNENQLQLRLAADAGIQQALLLLRENRTDSTLWYDNEPLFHNQVVWSNLGDRAKIDIAEEIEPNSRTYRFSLVADDWLDDLNPVRYGLTDECSKLNLNFATREQLKTLLIQVLPVESPVDALVSAVMDWRDQNDEPELDGAEKEYYLSLDPPYTIKNNMFETVEELLLVKGFSAGVLYGEDVDRDGYLDVNEDDGAETFPPDNQDGHLERGVYPFLTVWSRDLNRSNDNINRIDLNMADAQQLKAELEKYFSEEIATYVANLRRNGQTLTSPIQLLGHSYTPGEKKKRPNPRSGRDRSDNQDPTSQPGLIDDVAPEEESDEDETGESSGGGGAALVSPVTLEDLPTLCDRTTAIRQPGIMGAINVNTASREVLRCLVNGQLTEVDVEAIWAARVNLDPEKSTTPAWLLMNGVISQAALESIYPQITTRSQQFHIESIGHADHLGMMVRIQAVVELRGHVPQFLYYRDLTELGAGYPVRGIKKEGEPLVRHRRG